MTTSRSRAGAPSPVEVRRLTRDQKRGSAAARGYGVEHRRLREELRPLVEAGGVLCWRCGKLIPGGPRAKWHLGHDDNDRSQYKGPEHVACNSATQSHARQQAPANISAWWQ